MEIDGVYAFSEEEGKGRFVTALRPIKKGEVVICEEALTVAINRRHAEVSCSYCGATCDSAGTVYQVSPEDPLRYCSERCITVDYPVHQREVGVLAALAEYSNVFGQESFRTLVRVACLRSMEGAATVTPTPPKYPSLGRSNTFSTLSSLEAATACMQKETLASVRSSACSFSEGLQRLGLSPALLPEEVCRVVLAVQCNAHSIRAPSGESIGIGLFPTTSMMNHSCVPNCAHSFSLSQSGPPRLLMRAITDVAVGEELCYSYVPLYQSTAQRLAQLSAAYSFVCSCLRCTGDIGDSVLEATVGEDGTAVAAALKRIETCTSLMAKASLSQRTGLLSRLLAMLADATMVGGLDPAHRTLLQAYVCIANTAALLLENGGDTADPDLYSVAFSFGTLAIGCIAKFTAVESTELSQLVETVGRSLVAIGAPGDEKYVFETLPLGVLRQRLGSFAIAEDAVNKYMRTFLDLVVAHVPAAARSPRAPAASVAVNALIELALSNHAAEEDLSADSTLRVVRKVTGEGMI